MIKFWEPDDPQTNLTYAFNGSHKLVKFGNPQAKMTDSLTLALLTKILYNFKDNGSDTYGEEQWFWFNR
jgi:hypothetical protein